jgi:hypothetical protein
MDVCTAPDTCLAGFCQGTPLCPDPLMCDGSSGSCF